MDISKSKLTLAAAAAAGVSLMATVAIPRTLGFFDATTSNPGNSLSAGTLTMSNSKNGSAVFTAVTNMKPGDVACNQVVVTNTGSLPAQVQISEANISGTNGLQSHLNMKIYQDGTYSSSDCTVTGGSSVYDGDFDALSPTKLTGSLSAGTGQAQHDWAPTTENHTYTVVVSFPNGTTPSFPTAVPSPVATSSDNVYQGGTASADLVFYSTQSTVKVVTH